jgi:hypothetical protein
VPNNAPIKSGTPSNNPNGCYNYGEVGHYSYQCLKKQNWHTPQNEQSNQRPNARPPFTGKVNHVSSESAQEVPEVMLGTFSVNSISVTVLFNSGASHSFISQTFVRMHSIPLCAMKDPMLVNSLGVACQQITGALLLVYF